MDIQASITFEEFCERYDECYRYLHDANGLLRHFVGVVGVGIGPRVCGGELLPEQPCFIVYVQKKLSPAELDARELIPREVLGIRTDVVAIGSRVSAAHNELDTRWLTWGREGFTSHCSPGEESYRQAS